MGLGLISRQPPRAHKNSNLVRYRRRACCMARDWMGLGLISGNHRAHTKFPTLSGIVVEPAVCATTQRPKTYKSVASTRYFLCRWGICASCWRILDRHSNAHTVQKRKCGHCSCRFCTPAGLRQLATPLAPLVRVCAACLEYRRPKSHTGKCTFRTPPALSHKIVRQKIPLTRVDRCWNRAESET